jgi:PUA-domain protein
MALKIKNRHRLKAKEITDIIQELRGMYHRDFFTTSSSVEVGDVEGFEVIIIDNDIDFFKVDNRIILTVRGVVKYGLDKQRVVVDMGAIKFITNGADIMAAGIKDADPEILPNEPVWICDETSGAEMTTIKTGKAIKNIHYVGDLLWNATKTTT